MCRDHRGPCSVRFPGPAAPGRRDPEGKKLEDAGTVGREAAGGAGWGGPRGEVTGAGPAPGVPAPGQEGLKGEERPGTKRAQ